MTSNLGSDLLLETMEKAPQSLTKENILTMLEPIIRTHFRPEFINRLDEILPFLPLRKEDMEQIVIIQMGQLTDRLKDRESNLEWTDEVVAYLAEKGYDPVFGARPLKRLIQHEIINMLSKAVLEGKIPANSTVHLKMDSGKITFDVK